MTHNRGTEQKLNLRHSLVRALEIGEGPDSLQTIVEVVFQPVGGAMPHTHSAILRPWDSIQACQSLVIVTVIVIVT